MSTEAPTFRAFVAAWTDFLTVATHTVLYERKIYPQTAFISARRYNFAVRQNRHPKVCEWINDAVAAVETEMLKCTVDQIALVIFNKQHKPIERYCFDVSRFPTVPFTDLDVSLKRVNSDGVEAPVLPMVDLEEQLRATMSRLSNCSSYLPPLPDNCTYSIVMELKDAGHAPLAHPQAWVPAEVQPGTTSIASPVDKSTTPIRSVQAGEMIFETWIDELKETSSEQTSFTSNSW